MKPILLIIVALLFLSCAEEVQEPEVCNVGSWAKADRNNENVCLGNVEFSYWQANTESAHVILSAGTTERVAVREISAEFSIPVSGIALNTEYPVTDGELAGADSFTSGFISFLQFDYPNCVAGTFQLFVEHEDFGIIQSYKNGQFVVDKINADCNPFN